MPNQTDGSVVVDTELDTTGFAAGSRKLHNAINSLNSKVSSLGPMLKRAMDGSFSSLGNFNSKADLLEETISKIENQLEALGSSKIPTDDYQFLQENLSKASEELERLYDRETKLSALGVKKDSQAWKSLQYDISLAAQKVRDYQAEIQQLENSGNAFQMGSDTEEYAALMEELMQAREELNSLREQADETESSLNRVANKKFTSLISWIKSSVINMRSFEASIKRGVNALTRFQAKAKGCDFASKGLVKSLTSVKTLLISRVKRMFISQIFNEMKEAMSSLEKYSDSFGGAMANIRKSAKELSGNLAVSFGGMLNTIEPIITRIINAISRAITYINALFSLLNGKSTMTVAKKQMDSFGAAAGGAADEVKDLNRQVYGFDELNKRQKQSDSGGGGGGVNSSDLFEEVPIDSYLPDSIKDFFERIKASFTAGDWEGIGSIISGGLSRGMGVVDNWITGSLQPMAFTWSERIARILNGLAAGTDWNLMGKSVADGASTVFGSLSTFLTTFDFKSLGFKFGNGITSIFENVDWENVGFVFRYRWTAAVDTINGIISGTDWSAVGKSVSQFFTGIFKATDWNSISVMLSGSVRSALIAIYSAIENFDWNKAGNDIIKNCIAFARGLDWTGVANALFHGIGAAIGGLSAFIWGIIQEAWRDVTKWWHDVAYEDGVFTMDGLKAGIHEAIRNIGTWIKTNIFEPFITGFKNAFGIHSPSTVMQEQGGFIIDGLLLGVKNGWAKITSFFSTSLSSLKTTFWTAWSNIYSSASTAWTNISSSVTNKWNTMKSTLSTGISSLKSTISTGWNSINTAATQAWSTISTSVTSKWNGLKSTLQNTNWSSVGSNICTGIGNGINSGWSWLSSKVSSLASSLLSTAKRALGIHSPSRVFRDEIGENIGLGLADGIENSKKDVNRSVAALAKSTVDAFGDNSFSLDIEGIKTIDGLNTVADRMYSIVDAFSRISAILDNIGQMPIPMIAAGAVVPAKNTAPAHDNNPDGLKQWFDDVDETMMNQNDTLREILDAIRKLKLIVDGDSITDSVFHNQRAVSRSFGG